MRVNRLREFYFTYLASWVRLPLVGETTAQTERGGTWTLLTGHGHVLVAIAREPQARLRDISTRVGLTERAVQLIVADLVAAGYLIRHRAGRRNHYTVNPDSPFRHPDQDGHRVGPFLGLLATAGDSISQIYPIAEPREQKDAGAPHSRRAGKRNRDLSS
jgi:DNA-binding MarR family transcriptional regulator